MLFSGGTAAKPKKDEKKEKKSDRDEKYEIQENVFVRWGNSLLANEPLKDFKDLCETKYMASIIHIVTGNALTLTGVRYEDCSTILNTLNDTKTNASELVDNQQKSVLGVWWNLIQAFWKRFGPEPIREEKLTEAVKQWCLEVTRDYEEVSVCDFTSSWRDGHAFNCLLHNFDRKLVHLKKLYECSAHERIENAFHVAEKEFRVPRLLLVKELQSEHLDTRSVVCYLMTLYLSLLGKSGMASSSSTNPDQVSSGSTSQSHSHTEGDHQHQHTSGHVPLEHQNTVVAQETPQPQTPPHVPQATRALPQNLVNQPSPASSPHAHHSGAAHPTASPEGKTPHRMKQSSVDQASESVEGRSRKSSSSSQKSGRSRRERKEAMTREFENCLEQVLTWLLEAEEELSLLAEVEEKDVALIRTQFKDFEQFMASLTDSQETVGRVLHRGQLLCGKAESDEERDAIQGQLHIVNQRWEELRAMALHRQTKLQTQLNTLQQKQLSSISRWLTSMETEVANAGPVAATTERILEQIEEHGRIQTKIDKFQPTILQLNTFVAVVDDGESAEESVASLESAMHSIGARWQSLCSWAENRTSQLDGLAEIVAQTGQVFDRLINWLKEREHELLGLKSAHHLDDPEEVADQVKKLQRAETALETEHGQFVRLSQLSCELVARLDSGNGAAANDVRRRLDTVTQRWDNLVARIEEHSKTLVRSGKADLKQLKQYDKSVDDSLTIDESLRADRVVLPDQATSSIQVTTFDAMKSEALADTTDTEGEEAGNQLVDRFLRHVAKLTTEMEPLRHWTDTFAVSKKPDQVRRMISVCQEKLVEIKDQEAKVTRLQLELEHIHLSASLNSKQLKRANDAFDQFAKGWARIVTKISEAMNVLTGHSEDGQESAIAQAIEEWIESSNRVLEEISRIPTEEQPKRLQKLEQQWKIQSNNLEFVEKDAVKKAILKKGLDIVRRKIDAAKKEESAVTDDEQCVLNQLAGDWCSVGDASQLEKDLDRSQVLVETARQGNMSGEVIEKAETRRAEMKERHRSTVSAFEKLNVAEQTVASLRDEVDASSRRDAELSTVLSELEAIRQKLTAKATDRKEAERATEKMLAMDEKVPEQVVEESRNRVRALTKSWQELEDSVEDHINCVRKELRRTAQQAISAEERILEKLEKSLVESESAADAEECCEHLDHLENLLEQVGVPDSMDRGSMDESFVRDNYARLSTARDELSTRVRERVAQLGKSVEEFELFERQMADIQSWSGVMSGLLSARRAADISALDVPEEYKELSKEFEEWDQVLNELQQWLNTGERKNNSRMHAQMDHAQKTFSDLCQKFSEFKHPKSFEEKLERTTRSLADIENALDDMTGIEGSACGDALLESKRLLRMVRQLEEELPGLEKGKQELIQGGILDKESASSFTDTIRFAKKKSEELGLRAEGAVDRLEDCVQLYDRLEQQSKDVDDFLVEIEQQLEEYSKTDQCLDEAQTERMVGQWNRNETSLKSLEDTERLLRENAVRVGERLCTDKRRRADALKRRLDDWNNAAQEMAEDEDEQLLQLDGLYQNVMDQLKEAEGQAPAQLAATLRFLRGDRDRLSSRVRHLAAKNPRLSRTDVVTKINDKWNELEKKLNQPEEENPTGLLSRMQIDEHLPFAEKVSLLDEKMKEAAEMVNFDSSPVSNVAQWSQRIENLDSYLESCRDPLDGIVEEGRKIATSGRMELESHTAIDRLDEICHRIDELEQIVDNQRTVISPLLEETESIHRDVCSMETVLDQLAQRTFSDAQVVKATRCDLLERDAQLSSLSQRAAAVHAELPGRSAERRDATLASLQEKVARLEAVLSASDATRAIENATPIRTSPDQTSMSSIGPLAMEAHGNFTDTCTTEDEGTRSERQDEVERKVEVEKKIILPENTSPQREDGEEKGGEEEKEKSTEIVLEPHVKPPLEEDEVFTEPPQKISASMDAGINMEKVFENLDNVEDQLSTDQQFPLEGLATAEKRYDMYDQLLSDAVSKVDEYEMTLDMMQVEHTRERIHHLRQDLDERRKRLPGYNQEWNKILAKLSEAEHNVSRGQKTVKDYPGPEAPVSEVEKSQSEIEQLLPLAETTVCDAVRQLGLILPRLTENGAVAARLRERVRKAEDEFRALARFAADGRARLDAALFDYDELKGNIDELQSWCDRVSKESSCKVNALDLDKIVSQSDKIQEQIQQLQDRKSLLVSIEAAKDQLIGQTAVKDEVKHECRRLVCDVAKKMADLRSDLSDRLTDLVAVKKDAEQFWKRSESIEDGADDLLRRVESVVSATIFTPSKDHIIACGEDAANLKHKVAQMKEQVQRANATGDKLSGKPQKRLIKIITDCDAAIASVSRLPEPSASESVTGESMNSSQATIIDVTGEHSDATSPVSSHTVNDADEEDTVEEEDVEEPEVAGTLSVSRSSKASEECSTQHLSARDEANWQSLTQLRHWLNEMERDAGLTVDLAEPQAVRNAVTTVQGVLDQVQQKIMAVVGIQDASSDSTVKQKAQDLVIDMERAIRQCDKRRCQLNRMGDEARGWQMARNEMELWLEQAETSIGERKAEETSEASLRDELSTVEKVISELDTRRESMDAFNSKGNGLLDGYAKDEGHSLSHQQSRLNMRWSKFNDNVRIRRAVLEASLRSRVDFHSALNEFEEWLDRMVESVRTLETQTSNVQAIKDTAKRREWSLAHKGVHAELEAHDSVRRAVDEMGRKMASGLDMGRDRKELQERLDAVDNRWKAVRETSEIIRNRLESAEQEWEKLTHTLSSLLSWIEDKSKETLSQQPVGGSISSVMSQGAWLKNMEREMESRSITVRETIANAHSYLMQHDLRPKMHRSGVLADDEDTHGHDNEQRRCGMQIHADCEQLKEKWAELGTQWADWQKVVQSAAQRLQELESALAKCQLHLSSVEAELENKRPVEQLMLEELKDARVESESLATKVEQLSIHVDDANDACGKILAADTPLDQHPRNQLDAVNQRFLALRTTMRIRVAALRNALSDFGPSSEHFLNQSVSAPWQRAISKTNQLPYYIDHTTERTQWEHPVWVEIDKQLAQFNRVKFIAYRTAMKLRALQKRLCFDLIDIPMLEKVFTRLGGLSNEECPALEGMVCCLLPLFEELHAKHPNQVRSVSLAVDLCINFLLNLFDPSRDGILRVLSFKIALVVFCNAQLEEKYRYLFDLVAQEGQADQKHIALLLYDLIHIPRLVGEAAAFGGSNVEPSVRSCFELVRLAPSMPVSPFLEWLKQEPQSIVWLPVMHRLAAAEFAKHSAKCNVCKMFPIVGLRYRCLRCFNLDLCQNCFFSQRVAKKHKLKHPMQEYAVPTTSSEDARDFAKMVRNKFARGKSSLGYLPVEMGEEGKPLAAAPATAHNPATDAIHQSTAAMSARLAALTAAQPAEPRDELDLTEVKSPAQLISQVEQMQKDELDQLLQRLQLENIELKRELEKRKTAAASTPQLDRVGQMSPVEGRRHDMRAGTLPRLGAHAKQGKSVPSLKGAQSQGDVMDEARTLRLHKQRLEHRSRILEQQNEQLELQLQRLKKVIEQQKESSTRLESWSAEREWAERRSQPPPPEQQWEPEGENRSTRMQSLLATVDDLGRAMESLVVSVVYDSEPDE